MEKMLCKRRRGIMVDVDAFGEMGGSGEYCCLITSLENNAANVAARMKEG